MVWIDGCIDAAEYLLARCRYIELNPVRAGMAAAPGDYPWSSWYAHAEDRASTMVVDPPEYTALGPTPEGRQSAYRALFAQALGDGTVTAIRDATHKAWPLGGDRFKEELARLTVRRIAPAKPGRPRKEEVAA